MNVYDSERMADALAAAGYAPVDRPRTADLILLNTCHIREKAAEKVYSELGRLRAFKTRRAAEGRSVTIGVAGCVAQAEGEEIMRRAPVGRPRRRAAILPAAARPRRGGRRGRTGRRDRFRGGGEIRRARPARGRPRASTPGTPPAAMPRSSPCRRAATSSAPSASSPIPAAPRCRGRSQQSSPRRSGLRRRACASSRSLARTSTPGAAKVPTGPTGASASSSSGLRKFRASTGCATRPATRATWTTT